MRPDGAIRDHVAAVVEARGDSVRGAERGMGMSRSSLGNFIRGYTKRLESDNVEALATYLAMDVDQVAAWMERDARAMERLERAEAEAAGPVVVYERVCETGTCEGCRYRLSCWAAVNFLGLQSFCEDLTADDVLMARRRGVERILLARYDLEVACG